jgi:hypothetical protein
MSDDIDRPTRMCKVCDRQISFDENDHRDSDEVCVRTKPYCSNKGNVVDWRTRALKAEAQLQAIKGGRDGD